MFVPFVLDLSLGRRCLWSPGSSPRARSFNTLGESEVGGGGGGDGGGNGCEGREAATLSRKPDGLTEHDSTVGWWATDGLFARSKPARPKESQEREKEREPSARWYGMEPRSVEMQQRRRQRRRRRRWRWWWRRLPAIVSFLNTYMVDDVSYDRLMWFLGRWPDIRSTCRTYVLRISYGARILSRYPYQIRKGSEKEYPRRICTYIPWYNVFCTLLSVTIIEEWNKGKRRK